MARLIFISPYLKGGKNAKWLDVYKRQLYKCGNDRYPLEVQAPEYKREMFGTGGGK